MYALQKYCKVSVPSVTYSCFSTSVFVCAMKQLSKFCVIWSLFVSARAQFDLLGGGSSGLLGGGSSSLGLLGQGSQFIDGESTVRGAGEGLGIQENIDTEECSKQIQRNEQEFYDQVPGGKLFGAKIFESFKDCEKKQKERHFQRQQAQFQNLFRGRLDLSASVKSECLNALKSEENKCKNLQRAMCEFMEEEDQQNSVTSRASSVVSNRNSVSSNQQHHRGHSTASSRTGTRTRTSRFGTRPSTNFRTTTNRRQSTANQRASTNNRRISTSNRRVSSNNGRASTAHNRFSTSNNRVSTTNRHVSPNNRRTSTANSRFSTNNGRVSTANRRVSTNNVRRPASSVRSTGTTRSSSAANRRLISSRWNRPRTTSSSTSRRRKRASLDFLGLSSGGENSGKMGRLMTIARSMYATQQAETTCNDVAKVGSGRANSNSILTATLNRAAGGAVAGNVFNAFG